MSAALAEKKSARDPSGREPRSASDHAGRSQTGPVPVTDAGRTSGSAPLGAFYAAGPALSLGVQAKLTVGAPGDPYEREADAVADRVTAGQKAEGITRVIPGSLGEVARQPEEEEPVQMHSVQRQEETDDEPVQMRLVQRQAEEADDESVQMRLVQRKVEEADDEWVQGRLVQRQAEEADDESIQTQLVQRQAEEADDESVQTQLIQRQAEEADDESVQTQLIQRQAEEADDESVQARRVQRQAEGSDEEPVQARLVQRQAEGSDEEPVQAQAIQRQAEDADDEPVQMRLAQRQMEEPDEPVQARSAARSTPQAAPEVESQLQFSKGGGEPLSEPDQADFESHFGHDFSSVRIHNGAEATAMSRSLGAQAFTHGEDIYFAPGKYDPHSRPGRQLLAHELTHVVQQGKAPAAVPESTPVQRREEAEDVDEDDRPSEEERAAALAAAEVAEGQATAAYAEGQNEIAAEQREKVAEDEARVAARDEAQQAAAATVDPTVEPGAQAGAGGSAEGSAEPGVGAEEETAGGEQEEESPEAGSAKGGGKAKSGRGQAKGAAVAKEDASDRAPASPEEDPAFQASVRRLRKVSQQQRSHDPAAAKATEAQDAAESPESEVAGKAQANQVDAMDAAEAPAFDKAAFKAQLVERIQATAPKTMADAEKFKKEDRLGAVKGELSGKVAAEKDASEQPVAEQAAAEPDTASIEPKPTTPLPAADAGPEPADVGAAKAAPKAKGQSEVEGPLVAASASIDDQMAEADVDEEQLRNSNEPEFQGAAAAKQEAKTHALEAPVEVRAFEQGQIAGAESEAAATARERTQGMHAERGQLLTQVEGQQGETKTRDEQARDQVAQHIQGLYESTKTGVETILGGLDGKVDTAFDEGAAAAKVVFEDYVDTKMTAYKERRYGGWFGWARWAKDKIKGMPAAVNAFYAEGRRLYLREMDAVIDNVVSIVGTGITEAKAEIAKGKQEIQDYVAQLPEDLQQVGSDAAADIEGRFDQLEQQVESKQSELVDSLAQKYRENLEAIDSRIEELKAANAGLIDKAINAVVGVIKAILKLKDMLFKVLAKVAHVVGTIIKDPIGFLGNLISGLKQGFENFAANIWTHLQSGLIGWLTGALGPAGIVMPDNLFSLKGIFSLVTQVLGLTWDTIRVKAVKLMGEPVVAALETGWEVFQILGKEGPMGLWEFIKDQFGDLKEAVIEQIKSMVITQVITAGVKWIMGLLSPAGAFIKAAMAIYDIVMFFVERGRQIIELVNSVIDSIAAIASGSLGAAAKMVEDTLARALPVVISFLASLLGLGGLAGKVQKIIQGIRKRIDRAIDKILVRAKKIGKKLLRKAGVGNDSKDAKANGPKPAGEDEPKVAPGEMQIGETVRFSADGEKHKLWIETRGTDAVVMMASVAEDIPSKLARYQTKANRLKAKDPARVTMQGLIQQAHTLHTRVNAPSDDLAAGAKQGNLTPRQAAAKNRQIKRDQRRLAGVMRQLEEATGEDKTPDERLINLGAKIQYALIHEPMVSPLRRRLRTLQSRLQGHQKRSTSERKAREAAENLEAEFERLMDSRWPELMAAARAEAPFPIPASAKSIVAQKTGYIMLTFKFEKQGYRYQLRWKSQGTGDYSFQGPHWRGTRKRPGHDGKSKELVSAPGGRFTWVKTLHFDREVGRDRPTSRRRRNYGKRGHIER